MVHTGPASPCRWFEDPDGNLVMVFRRSESADVATSETLDGTAHAQGRGGPCRRSGNRRAQPIGYGRGHSADASTFRGSPGGSEVAWATLVVHHHAENPHVRIPLQVRLDRLHTVPIVGQRGGWVSLFSAR